LLYYQSSFQEGIETQIQADVRECTQMAVEPLRRVSANQTTTDLWPLTQAKHDAVICVNQRASVYICVLIFLSTNVA
jgi:hypothetical protein